MVKGDRWLGTDGSDPALDPPSPPIPVLSYPSATSPPGHGGAPVRSRQDVRPGRSGVTEGRSTPPPPEHLPFPNSGPWSESPINGGCISDGPKVAKSIGL